MNLFTFNYFINKIALILALFIVLWLDAIVYASWTTWSTWSELTPTKLYYLLGTALVANEISLLLTISKESKNEAK